MYPPLKSFKLVVIVTTCRKFDKLIVLFEKVCFLLFKSHFKQLYSIGNRPLVLVFYESSVASFSIPIEYWNLFLSSETFWKTPYLSPYLFISLHVQFFYIYDNTGGLFFCFFCSFNSFLNSLLSSFMRLLSFLLHLLFLAISIACSDIHFALFYCLVIGNLFSHSPL